MLDHVVNTCCQLDPEKFNRRLSGWVTECKSDKLSSAPPLALLIQWGLWLPDALGGVDDGLHYVVSNELPVLLGDVINRRLCA